MKQKSHPWYFSSTIFFTITAGVLGIIYSIIATCVAVSGMGLQISPSSCIEAQASNPLLWFVDLTTVFMVSIAHYVGVKKDQLKQFSNRLERTINERTAEILKEKRFFEALVLNSPIAIVTLDNQHQIVSCNPAFENLFGFQWSDIIGIDLDDLISTKDEKEEAVNYTQAVLNGKNIYGMGKRHRKDGSTVDVEIFGVPVCVDNEQIGLLGLYHDITERKRAEEALQLNAKVFENAKEGIIITDADANIITVNEAFTDITGYDAVEVIGKNPRILKSNKHSAEFYQDMWNCLINENHWQGEIWNRHKDGIIYTEWLSIATVKNTHGEVINYVAVFNDITMRKEIEAYLNHVATHDPLTDLSNRTLFYDRLDHAITIAKRNGEHLAVLFLDLDNFKNVNDTYGHRCGDLLLQEVANRLREGAQRASDTISRLGGDEFTIVLEKMVSPQNAYRITHTILSAITRPFLIDGTRIEITASIGVSYYPDDGEDAESLLKHADDAMYRCKESGKNGMSYFHCVTNQKG